MTFSPVLRSFRWLVAAACALPLLAGCGIASKLGITPSVDTCRDAQAFEAATEVPAVQVPAGLDSPSARGALKTPVLDAAERKRAAGDNPWGAGATTLEWTISSPPPFHTFSELPRISDTPHH